MSGTTDGRKPKFRILCRKCNSYLHTSAVVMLPLKDDELLTVTISCSKCGNTAKSFEEERSC